MIIDAHNHPDWGGFNLQKFLHNMEENNIDKTWLLSWECPADEYDPYYYSYTPEIGPTGPIPFNRCLSYAERVSDKFILGHAPDPRRPDAIDRFKAISETYGVKIYGELKLRMVYDNPDALRVFRFCGERGVPVVLHIDYPIDRGTTYPRPNYWYGGSIEAMERAMKACPETIFIGHAPGFWAHISGDGLHDKISYPESEIVPGGKLLELMYNYSNLYCDISGNSGLNAISRDKEFGKKFLLEFQDRILYARDCLQNDHQVYINSLELPEEVLNKIYCGNACKLVPLD